MVLTYSEQAVQYQKFEIDLLDGYQQRPSPIHLIYINQELH